MIAGTVTAKLDISGLPDAKKVMAHASFEMDEIADLLVEVAQDNVRSQYKVTDQSAILNSIHKTGQTVTEDSITQRVGSDWIGARVQEYGGVIKAVRGPFLIFYSPEFGWRKVPQVTIPARPYLRPALQTVSPIFANRLQSMVVVSRMGY